MYQALPVTADAEPEVVSLGCEVLEPSPGPEGVKEAKARAASVVAAFSGRLEERTALHLGYPYNLDFDFEALGSLQKFSINNLGDPFVDSNYGVHSREFEVAVLEWFAKMWSLPKEEMWGYVTNCGTEGNLHGILTGREALPDGVLYTSKETHYSVMKAARMYRMDAVEVATLPSGEVDYAELQRAFEAGKNRPAIVNVNIGTTVKGAVDDLDKVLAALTAAGFTEDRFYIHCDGALFGLMMPFVREKAAVVDFTRPIGSISVSGHKFIGAPVPCGVVMTRMSHITKLSNDIEYLNSKDATIMGSRNGHAAVYMWYNLTIKGVAGFRADVEHCMQNARLLHDLLSAANIPVTLNPLSSTVVFERPTELRFIRKWQLACEGAVAHVVVMPSVSAVKLRAFVEDLVGSRARMAKAELAAPRAATCHEDAAVVLAQPPALASP